MIILYYLEYLCFLCILWVLEELGLEYEVKFYKCLLIYVVLFELKNIYFLGKVFVLIDGDLVIVEFVVILEYL